MENRESTGCCSTFHEKWVSLKELKEKCPKIPKCVYVVLAVLLVIQGTWIFIDSKKRGLNEWFWGPIGFLSLPFGLIVYLIATKRQIECKWCNLIKG